MQLSMMDSNNFISNVGVGEEKRIFSTLVSSVCMDWVTV